MIRLAGDAPVHIHLAEQAKEVEDCLNWCGQRPATWLLDAFESMNDGAWCTRRTLIVRNSSASPAAVLRPAYARSPKPTWAMAFSRPRQFLALSGSFGIGSDSNVLIDAAEELRVLEYTQRLASCPQRDGAPRWSLNRATLFQSALDGGNRALGAANVGFRPLASADFIALDSNHDALADRSGDGILDGWVFAARPSAIDCLWRSGKKVVSGGRHVLREGSRRGIARR